MTLPLPLQKVNIDVHAVNSLALHGTWESILVACWHVGIVSPEYTVYEKKADPPLAASFSLHEYIYCKTINTPTASPAISPPSTGVGEMTFC